MGKLFAKIFGGGVGSTLEGAGRFAKDLREAITGDIPADKKAELELKAQALEAEILRAQTEVNKAEAQSGNLFVAGWRPAIGWTGAIALFFHYVARPILDGIEGITLPAIDLAGLYPIIIGMLGLGAYRTVEKARGVQGKH